MTATQTSRPGSAGRPGATSTKPAVMRLGAGGPDGGEVVCGPARETPAKHLPAPSSVPGPPVPGTPGRDRAPALPTAVPVHPLTERCAVKVWEDGRWVETVTVCSACLTASCWQGWYGCDEYYTAGTVEKTPAELRALNLEHPSHWEQPCRG